MDKITKNLTKILLVLLIIISIMYLFPTLKEVIKLIILFLLPFLIGFTIAFMLNPLVDYFEKKKCNRKIISLLVLLLFVGIIVGLFIWVSPIVIKETGNLVNNLDTYLNNVENIINVLCEKFNLNVEISNITYDKIINLVGITSNQMFDLFSKIIQGIFSYAFALLLSVILALYFLIDFHKITCLIKKYLVKKEKEKYIPLFKELRKTMYSYIGGVFLVMFLMIVITSVCFYFLGLPLYFLWGIIVGITNIIPYIGPYIGGFIVGLFTLGSMPDKILGVVLIIVVLQLLESNFITPKVESKTVKIHPILAIFSVALLGEILGIFGMLLAVPLVSIIQIIVKYQKYN